MQTFDLSIYLHPTSVDVSLQEPPNSTVIITAELGVETQMESYIPLIVTLNSEVIGS